jgi:hypothetical protein
MEWVYLGMDIIINTLFTFKNIKSGEYIFSNASYSSIVEFMKGSTTQNNTIEIGNIISVSFSDTDTKLYIIKEIRVHIHTIQMNMENALPYSYHVHVNVAEY